MDKKADSVKLKSGRGVYAYGRTIGLCLDSNNDTIYYGHDGYVGEGEGGLAIEEQKEICQLMIKRWSEYLEKLNE